MTYYFIVNPLSCGGRGARVWQSLEKQLQQEKTDYQVQFTTHCRHARELAETISSRHAPCTIIAVGGDGTANEVIDGLTNMEQIIFGYIPSGSANDLARGLGLSTNPMTALHAVLHPMAVQPIRIGCAQTSERTRRFIVSSGFGFDAAVCHEALRSPIKKFLNRFGLGKLTYLGIALKQLLLLQPTPVTMILDDRRQYEFSSVFFIAAMNLRFEGGGFMFCPEADPCDPYLDICVIERMSRLRVLRLLPTAFTGRHVRYQGVHIYRCRRASIRALSPQAIHTDGENAGMHRNITMELEETALPMIIA